jgi:AbrB family looped-hinge helix DNA binding protein
VTGKLTGRGQITLPKRIRETLDVHPGDALVYEIDGNAVRVWKAKPLDVEWHRALSQTMTEWDSAQ